MSRENQIKEKADAIAKLQIELALKVAECSMIKLKIDAIQLAPLKKCGGERVPSNIRESKC